MASSPPGCRLPVVAVVAAGRGVRPREGATRRRHEVARGQKPPRRILPARESPVDTPRLGRGAEAATPAKFSAPPPAVSVLGEIEALIAAARRAGGPSVALVFAASSFEDRFAE